MPDKEKLLGDFKERIAEDEAILKAVRADRALLEEIRYKILKDRVHAQLMDLVTDAINNGNVQVESVEDLLALVELDLLLLT